MSALIRLVLHMEFVHPLARLAMSLVLLYVWLFRFVESSPYLGGVANVFVEGFSDYGLSLILVWIAGSLKVTAAIALILSIFILRLTLPATALISILMAGAIAMHVRIKDRLIKSVQAAALLVMTLVVAAT